jgi:hypothetical protein
LLKGKLVLIKGQLVLKKGTLVLGKGQLVLEKGILVLGKGILVFRKGILVLVSQGVPGTERQTLLLLLTGLFPCCFPSRQLPIGFFFCPGCPSFYFMIQLFTLWLYDKEQLCAYCQAFLY